MVLSLLNYPLLWSTVLGLAEPADCLLTVSAYCVCFRLTERGGNSSTTTGVEFGYVLCNDGIGPEDELYLAVLVQL